MVKYVLKRIGYLLLTLFIVASITFFLMKLLPGTPSITRRSPAAQIAILRKQYGLDLPVWQQYLNYMVGIAHGDFGESYQFAGQTVSYLISTRIGPSLQLGVSGYDHWDPAGYPAGRDRRDPQEYLGGCHCHDFRHHRPLHPQLRLCGPVAVLVGLQMAALPHRFVGPAFHPASCPLWP